MSMCDTTDTTRPLSIDGQVLFSLGDVHQSRLRTMSETLSESAVIPDSDEETFIVDRGKPTSANLQRSRTMPARNQHAVHIETVQLPSQDQIVVKMHNETSAVRKMSPSGQHSSTVINNKLSQSSDNTSNLLADDLDTFHFAETNTSLKNLHLSDTSREINLVSKAIVSDLCNRTRGDNLSFQQPVSSHREARSSSSDSSKTSKSRADSFNTDSNTSGVSSYESSTVVTFDPSSLSPVTSTTSINSIGVTKRQTASEFQKVHPSTAQRKSANLTRIPSIRKQHKNPTYGIVPSRMFDNVLPDSSITYTMNRDAFGYATLRNLNRQRTSSSDMESEYGLSRLYEDDEFRFRSQSIGSQKSMDTYSGRSR